MTLYWMAAETPRHGIPAVAELEADGWVKARPHPWYKDTWLMKKVEDEADRV